MSDWFKSTGEYYPSRISRPTIGTAVAEARGEQKALAVKAAKKKTEAVTIADRLLEGSSWPPIPLSITPLVGGGADEDAVQNNQE